jgi:hypothetical protein
MILDYSLATIVSAGLPFDPAAVRTVLRLKL